MSNKVFIIGNGFDLDLGMHTRYSDFAKSDKWPSHKYPPIRSLASFLKSKAKIEKWFDLEKELLSYAVKNEVIVSHTRGYNSLVEDDKSFYLGLVESLIAYLKEEEARPLNKDSVASKVLKTIIESRLFSSIYSFAIFLISSTCCLVYSSFKLYLSRHLFI